MKTLFSVAFGVLLLLTLVAWHLQPDSVSDNKVQLVWSSDDNPARREQIALFNRTHSDCILKLDVGTYDMSKTIVQSVAGVGPDVFDCVSSQLPYYVKAGVALDVTDELRAARIDTSDIWPEIHLAMKYDGRVYGLAGNAGTDNILFNKSLFDKNRLPYPKGPWTWREFLPVAQRLTIRDARGKAKQFGVLVDWYWWHQFVLQWGGRVFTQDGARCVLDSPEAIAAIEFMRDLIYKYRVAQSPADETAATQGGWGSETQSWFGAGKAAMVIGGRWWLCGLRGYKGLRLGAVEVPYYRKRIFVGVGRAVLVNKNSPHRKEALEFLKFLASREYNELVNHQADAVAPVISYSQTRKFLHDPDYPQEDYNRVWVESLEHAVPDPTSSQFISNTSVWRIVTKQLDLVRANSKTAEAAMKTATRQINEQICTNVERDSSLRREYNRVVSYN